MLLNVSILAKIRLISYSFKNSPKRVNWARVTEQKAQNGAEYMSRSGVELSLPRNFISSSELNILIVEFGRERD